VTTNYKSILLTALLALVVVYIYSLIGFLFFRSKLVMENKNICENMFMCLVQFVNFGIRSGGGIGDAMTAPNWNEENAIFRITYDATFFFLVIIILMNILFGIIIDTFGELRAKANSIQEDIENKCFICGIDRREFDRLSQFGFEHHINVEHNPWNYLAFNMYLKRKEKTEYTGPEQYVSDMIQNKNYRFIPHLCSLSIKNDIASDEDENNTKMIQNLNAKLLHLENKTSAVEDHLVRLSSSLDSLEESLPNSKQGGHENLTRSNNKVNSLKIDSLQKNVKDIDSKLTKLLGQLSEASQKIANQL